jgi:hypothetical protein
MTSLTDRKRSTTILPVNLAIEALRWERIFELSRPSCCCRWVELGNRRIPVGLDLQCCQRPIVDPHFVNGPVQPVAVTSKLTYKQR